MMAIVFFVALIFIAGVVPFPGDVQ